MTVPGVTSEGFKSFDLVVVPFPFTDRATSKRRPALVLSTPRLSEATGHVVAAMVTTTSLRWDTDVELRDPLAAGLVDGSIVRAKVFTIPIDLVLRRLGRLSSADVTRVREGFSKILDL